MQKKNKIIVLATFANDKLLDERGLLLREQKGGPAFYIKNALRREGADFTLKRFPMQQVEITLTKDGEFGRVPKRLPPYQIKPSSLKTSYLVISTVLNEFDLNAIPDYQGKIFLDVQGYVRDGRNFGKKKYWKIPKQFAKSIFCLKATEQELFYLPRSVTKDQKKKLLLVTKGRNGCMLFIAGRAYRIKPQTVVKADDTIGAGDTFFACFVSKYIKTENALASATYATRETEKFLRLKNIITNTNHHNHPL